MFTRPCQLAIDMYDPPRTSLELGIETADLLELVNDGRLAAYDFGEGIRFRASDVSALASRRVSV